MNAVEAYQAQGTERDAERLILEHAELVKRIAYHLAGRLPASVDVNDLIQAGMLGLLEAAGNFAAGRGASFSTYAGIRIRGAMIDALRKLDWAPRSVHRKSRAVSAAIASIEGRTGREARDAEIAEEMGISLQDYHQISQDTVGCQLASLDSIAASGVDDEQSDPFRDTASDQFRKALAREIDSLPERERMVMSLYYERELNLKEIGRVLNVTESRVCQIHGQAIARLRGRLLDWEAGDGERAI
ncbi:MAG: RNA polymerase sigma factor FliA [Steroidobacteraceae bacterium]